jgi:hypothetical protein
MIERDPVDLREFSEERFIDYNMQMYHKQRKDQAMVKFAYDTL